MDGLLDRSKAVDDGQTQSQLVSCDFNAAAQRSHAVAAASCGLPAAASCSFTAATALHDFAARQGYFLGP